MADTTSGRRGRPRGFDRDHALEQAVIAFWEHGYEPTSIADLTRRMEINAPSLYAAFGGKKALFTEAVERYQRTHGAFAMRAVNGAATAYEGVAAMLQQAAAAYTAPEHPAGCLVISAAANCAAGSGDVARLLSEKREANVQLLRKRMAADVAAGTLPPDTDPETLARFVAATLQGMSQQARDGASRAQLEAVATTAMRAWPRPPDGDVEQLR